MFRKPLSMLFILTLAACGGNQESEDVNYTAIPVTYPETRRDSTVSDDYHGTVIQDPYRWLEDDMSDETKDWVARQNEVTFGYLGQIPFREKIRQRLEKLFNFERYSAPTWKGKKYYYFRNDGLQNQNVLYAQETLDGEAKLVLDPNKLSADGTTSLAEYSISGDGRFLAYAISEGGSDWRTVRVLDLNTMQPVTDSVKWVKFSAIDWQGEGFFYSRFPAPRESGELSGKNEFHRVYYHTMGTSQDQDKLIYEDKVNPQRTHMTSVTSDHRYLVIMGAESTSGNSLMIKDLSAPNNPVVTIVSVFDHDYELIDHINGKLYFLTNNWASNQRVVAIDPAAPAADRWQVIIPESEDVLSQVQLCGGKLVANYIHRATSKLKVFATDGSGAEEILLPGLGTINELRGDKDQPLVFFSFTQFTKPTSIYRYSLEDKSVAVFKEPTFDFPSADYETTQVTYKSKDGTDVSMFLVQRKGAVKSAKTPVWLYGYGGFNISVMPRFWAGRIPFLENGGVMAIANIRGGGEFGKEWHKAGTQERKQNVFDDFIGAAEYLIAEGYTSKEKIAIEGGSNGGLLVGACMTQRPDLFRVAIPRVGVLDMLRYHQFTIGWAWATDYGRSDDPAAFEYLMKYSPLHNIKDQAYPATIAVTADHDDRVVPAHTFKFMAELQAHQKGDLPVLLRIETSAGHGAGKPVSKQIEEETDILSFMFYNMNHKVKY